MKNEERKAHLHELLAEFDNAMLVSHAENGELRARPMVVVDTVGSDELWFVTSAESGKVDELATDPRVVVTMQARGRYLSLSGRAHVVHDPGRVQSLWKRSWLPWFPQGKEDPSIVLLRIEGGEAEYWDITGMNRLRYLFEAGKAVLRGEKVADTAGHQKVEL